MFDDVVTPRSRRKAGAAVAFSTGLHVALLSTVVVAPLWAVQDPADPPARIFAVDLEPGKAKDTVQSASKDITATSSDPVKARPRPGGPRLVQPAPVLPDAPLGESRPREELPGDETTAGDPGGSGTGDPFGSPSADGNREGGGSGESDASESDIHAVGDLGVTAPTPLFNPDPVYTETMRRSRAQGIVVLEAIIGADGNVRGVRSLSGANALLERAAIETVSRWRYAPARIGSRAVSVFLTVRISFLLR
jgi:protein TonB